MLDWRESLVTGYKRKVAFDIETSDGYGHGSVDNKTGHIALMQMNIDDEEIKLLRPTEQNLKYVKSILEDPDTVVVLHNAQFDLGFLAQVGIFPRVIFDTQIASQLLYSGYTTPDAATKEVHALQKVISDDDAEVELFDANVLSEIAAYKETKASRFSHSLAVVLRRELGITIPKEARMSDWTREPLSPAQKEYAENDVKYLLTLAKILEEKLLAANLKKVAILEMELIKVTTFLEFTGFAVDEDGWEEQVKKLQEELIKIQEDLEERIGMKLAKDKNQVGLFGLVPVPVNLNSSVQMAKIFGLPDVQEQTLEHAHEYIKDQELLKLLAEYKEYKKLQKLVSTYGSSYLQSIYKGRLRGNFSQTQTATGRYSSYNPNLQNVPPNFLKGLVRGSKLPNGKETIPISADYSQVELRVLAQLSGDENFIEATTKEDLHSETARRVFGIPEDKPVPKDLRRAAKCVHPWSLVNVVVNEDENGSVRRVFHVEEIFDAVDLSEVDVETLDSFIGPPAEDIFISVGGDRYKKIEDRYISIPSRLTAVITKYGITLTTPNHKFKDKLTKEFRKAEDLQPGDELIVSHHFIDYDFFATTKVNVNVTDDGVVVQTLGRGDGFFELDRTVVSTLGRMYDKVDLALERLEMKLKDYWGLEVLGSIVKDYKIPFAVINNALLSATYIEGVRYMWSVKGYKVGDKRWRLPITDENLIFLSQLLPMSKAHYTKAMWVEKVEDGYIYLASKEPEDEGKILAVLETDNEYPTVDLTVEGREYALNGIISHNTVNFGLPYGVSAKGLVARGFFDDIEKAEETIEKWREGFPKAWEFLQKSADAAESGATRDAIGRRRNYELPKKPRDFEKKVKLLKELNSVLSNYELSSFEVSKYDSYKDFKEEFEETNKELLALIREAEFKTIKEIHKYKAQIAAIRRQGQNMPIQATSASITKLALVKIYNEMLKRGDFFPTLTVHDSIFVEADKERAIEIANVLSELMQEAAREVLPGLNAPVDVDFGWMTEYECVNCGAKVKKFNYYVENEELKEVDPSKVLCEECEEKAGS